MNFLDKDSLQLMYREIFIMIVFLCGILYMLHAVLNSNVDVHEVLGINISYHYIFTLVVSFLCFLSLLYKFISIYRLVIRDMSISDNSLILNNLVADIKIKDFFIFIEEKK